MLRSVFAGFSRGFSLLKDFGSSTRSYTGLRCSRDAEERDRLRDTRADDIVDVSGSAAMARATLMHGKRTFTDYFVLLLVNGEWKIANKVYSARPAG